MNNLRTFCNTTYLKSPSVIVFESKTTFNAKILILLLIYSLFGAQRVEAQEIKATDSKGTIVNIRNNQVTTSSTPPNNPLINDVWFDTSISNNEIAKIWDGTLWKTISSSHTVGDIKAGVQTTDHNGWIRLDGRSTTSLTATQQTRATSLGFSANLPNANHTYLSQNGLTLGSVNGVNTRQIARDQLPLFTLSGTTSSNGLQNLVDVGGSYNAGHNTAPVIGHWAVVRNVGTAGNHNHTITTDNINNTGTQQNIDIKPMTLTVNMFIFLGD